VSRTTCN